MIPPIIPKTKLMIIESSTRINPVINGLLVIVPILEDINPIMALMFPKPKRNSKPMIKPPINPEIAPKTAPSFSSILS
jgi:hypothetical protein